MITCQMAHAAGMTSLTKRVIVTVAVLSMASVGASCGSSDHAASPRPVIDPGDDGRYHASLDPNDTVEVIDNPYLPLRPGMRWVYKGSEDGVDQIDTVEVTTEHHDVMGVSAVVVRDTVTERGKVVELTDDWYTQDTEGNVWYLGENTAEYANGKVTSREGTWEWGTHRGQPGIAMPAHPKVGMKYREEFDKGNAEDAAEVLRTTDRAQVPTGTYTRVLVVREWTRLEPKIVEYKKYAPGVGEIEEGITRGGQAHMSLVEFTPVPSNS
jgi:hypothetical protein